VNCTNCKRLWCWRKEPRQPDQGAACCCAWLPGWSDHQDRCFILPCALGTWDGGRSRWETAVHQRWWFHHPTSAGAVPGLGTSATTPSPTPALATSWSQLVWLFFLHLL